MAGPRFKPNPKKTVDDQVNREQKHADVFGDFHGVDSSRLLRQMTIVEILRDQIARLTREN